MKNNVLLAAVLCCAMTTVVLTACTDNDDAPEQPVSAVDHGEWLLGEENMDTSVRPDDDFYMYYTIGENIADLGGFLMAYDTYVRYLRDKGFIGEELELQRKRFYMAYAWLWHSRYSIKFAQVRTLGEGDHAAGKDYHSLLRERANGVVMNTDDWYELFDVKESDKLYRTSDQRIKIG